MWNDYLDNIRKTGYIFLLLGIIEFINILVPPGFTNPVWEFQTMGKFVDLIWVPLIGFLLIFIPPESPQNIRIKEYQVLKILSWLSLVIGIIYILMIPLILIDANRISVLNQAQLITQSSAQKNKFEVAQQQISKITPTEIESLIKQGKIPTGKTVDDLQKDLLLQLNADYKNGQSQVKTIVNGRQKELLKSTIKWAIGSIISALLMFQCWKFSEWIRIMGI